MAKENNEICDIIKKCKILLLDIEGTTTSISFVKDKLFPYAEENAKGFLEGHWENDDVKEAVAALRKQAAEDQEKSVEGFVAIPGEDATKDEQIEGLVNNMKWQMAADRKAGPLKQLQGLIWKLGYDKGDIKGHVYDDVSPALELWRSTEGQKVYIYSSGSVQAQKLLFNKSLAGDMLPLIEGHFDTAVGAKQEAASYAAIVEKIGCKAEEILFLTDIVKEAEAARASGLHAALVSREGNAPLPTEAYAYPVLHSFEQLTVTNKRKPEPQIEEVPAKVPKTEALNDVTTAESAITNGSSKSVETMETAAVVEKADAPETMEVEETVDVAVVGTKETLEKNEPAVETKTVPAEIAEISEKDVTMDDAVVDVPAVIELPPVETTVAMADSTEIAETVAPVSNNVTAPTAENANAESSIAKAEVVVPEVAETDVQEVIDASPKSKAKMVDVATITDVNIVTAKALTAKALAFFGPSADVIKSLESKSAEAVTEVAKTKNGEEATVTLKTEASDEKPKKEETPAAEATAEVSSAVESTTVDVVAKDTMDAPHKESKDMEADPSPITDVVEPTVSKIEVTTTTDLKTADVSSVDSKPMESEDVAEADAKKANDTAPEIPTQDSSSVPDATKVAAAAVVENLSATEMESVQNGVEKSTDKPAEMAIEEVEEKVPDQKDPDDAQASVIEPIVEKIEEKTEPNETEKMETDTAVIVEEVDHVVEPKEAAEDTVNEAILSPLEVKDITDDKESLSEVTDIMDDVVPIVEEPSQLEEMEELQNAGDVLEKECDEILSKVQDVTNLDYMPVKPLHTIAEEMETENTDTNDIVERILDSEMELSMKPEDIDLNTVQEITEPKTDTDERICKIEPGTEKLNETPKIKDVAEEKMGVSSDAEMVLEKLIEPAIDNAKEATNEPIVEEMETEEAKVDLVKESKTGIDVPLVVPVVESVAKPDESEAKAENKEAEKALVAETVSVAEKASVAVTQENGGSQDAKKDEATDSKVNGKSNGDAIVKLNGDARKDDDLKSRLTAEETVKEKVNGSNGDSANTENAQGDNKAETETPDIKVKTVATDEAHTPMEQPVEA